MICRTLEGCLPHLAICLQLGYLMQGCPSTTPDSFTALRHHLHYTTAKHITAFRHHLHYTTTGHITAP